MHNETLKMHGGSTTFRREDVKDFVPVRTHSLNATSGLSITLHAAQPCHYAARINSSV